MKRQYSYKFKRFNFFPLVDIVSSCNKKSIHTTALVDSGATYSVFRPEFAKYLDIELEQGKKIYLEGIGGRILGYLHTIDLNLYQDKDKHKIKIVFSPELKISFNLIGQDNFFDLYKIIFERKNKKVIVEDY